jgi:succinyl-CoA synthetase beta subunit
MFFFAGNTSFNIMTDMSEICNHLNTPRQKINSIKNIMKQLYKDFKKIDINPLYSDFHPSQIYGSPAD